MNIKKKIRDAYSEVPLPAAEDVLPEGAFEEKRVKSFSAHRPIIYAVATVCICVIIAVAAVMARPSNDPIADTGENTADGYTELDATKDETPATTCEEVWAYIKKDYYANQMGNDSKEEVPAETEKILLVTSEGKHLIAIRYTYYTKEELWGKFEEKYGFDYGLYWDYHRLKEEGCALILGREYQEGDEYNEKVIEFQMKIAYDMGELRRELDRERAEKILEDCGYSFEDVHSFDYFLLVYVNENDIETIRNHELVEYIMEGQRFFDSLMIKLENH